ncbi:hypothetical protein CC2G_013798 [Coprinopsis cinerea AmutBmut pab1-1]|nr:hypothetical protein CC2G_013798 [Coprinopsis cinerea AmutBmut pab1-1]
MLAGRKDVLELFKNANQVDQWIKAIIAVPASNWANFSCYTMLVYDYLCTLEKEVAYVWTCPWSWGLPLFYVNRYLPFIDQLLMLHVQLGGALPESCTIQMKVAALLMYIGSVVSQMIIVLRTLAIWRGNKKVCLLVLAVLVGSVVSSGFIVHTQVMSIKFFDPGIPQTRCLVLEYSVTPRYAFISILVLEILIVILTIIKARQHFRQSNSSWVIQIYKNGIFFCICMTILTLLNLLLTNIPSVPLYYTILSAPTQRVLHSIFCNRVMLQILEHRKQVLGASEESQDIDTHDGSNLFTTIHLHTFGQSTHGEFVIHTLPTPSDDAHQLRNGHHPPIVPGVSGLPQRGQRRRTKGWIL